MAPERDHHLRRSPGKRSDHLLPDTSNLEIRVGTRRARVSSDLDAVRGQSLEAFRDQLAEALRDGWDALTGFLVDDGEIPAPLPEGYRPYRFRVKLQFRGGDFGTILIEVAPTEIGAEQAACSGAVSRRADTRRCSARSCLLQGP